MSFWIDVATVDDWGMFLAANNIKYIAQCFTFLLSFGCYNRYDNIASDQRGI